MTKAQGQKRRAHGMVPLAGPQSAQMHSGIGSAMKPAYEPIVVARKPLSEKNLVQNILKHGEWLEDGTVYKVGTGGLNIDQSRVNTTDNPNKPGPNGGMGGDAWRSSEGRDDRMRVQYEPSPQGRFPANLLLSHVPGPNGCVRVGSRRVKPGNGSGTAKGQDKRPLKRSIYGSTDTLQQDSGFVDPDGLEEVPEYICAEGGTTTVPSFSYRTGALTPLSLPEYLLGQLGALLEDLREYSKAYSSLSLRAFESYRNERKLSAASSGDPDHHYQRLFDEVSCALGVSTLPSFRACCQPCRRLCGVHAHHLLEAVQASPRQLHDALAGAHTVLLERVHSPHRPGNVLPSLGDSAQPETLACTLPSKTGGERQPAGHPELETPHHNGGTSFPLQDAEGTPSSTPESSSSESAQIYAGCENPDHTACIDASTRLLASLAFDLATYILPSVIIQRREIDINLTPCPIKALDEQSGVRQAGAYPIKDGVPGSNGTMGGGWSGNGRGGREETGAGGASRFFVNFSLDPNPGFFYSPKASRAERNRGLEGMPETKAGLRENGRFNSGGRTLVNGEWQETNSEPKPKANTHPCVKPLSLMRYLLRLVTPPSGTCLDPFSGSFTTGVACIHEGFNFIGIEQSLEYCEIGERRMAHALRERVEPKKKPKLVESESSTLF